MRPVARAACVLLALGVASGLAGCSSSKGSTPATTAPVSQTQTTTVSARRIALLGAIHVTRARTLLAAERRYCGGTDRIAPPSAATAARCSAALVGLAAEARSFARSLVFLRVPANLAPLVAATIDAARPLVDLVHSYPLRACLSAPVGAGSVRSTRCAGAGNDVAVVIDEFEKSLDGWRAIRQ